MRNRSTPANGTRADECSEFVELARRMSVPADVAIHEFMGLGARNRPADRDAVRVDAELATADR